MADTAPTQLSVEELQAKMAEAFSKELKTSLPEVVKEQVDAAVKAAGMDKIDVKHGMVPMIGVSEADQELMTKRARVGQFFKAVFRKDMGAVAKLFGTKAYMNETTGSEGGYLVPEEVAAELARVQLDYGLIRKLARHFKMKREKFNVPSLAGSVTAEWVDEAGEKPTTNPTFGNILLEANTAAGIAITSNQLFEDTDISIADMLLQLFAESLAQLEDDQGFNGTGTPFTGIFGTSTGLVNMGSGDTDFADISVNYALDMIAALPSSLLNGAVFTMHRSVWNTLLKATEGSIHMLALSQNLLTSEKVTTTVTPVGTLIGYPVYANDAIPSIADTAVSTKFAAFGNFGKGFYFGDRDDQTAKTTDSGTVDGVSMFETNQTATRVEERVALAVALPTAFVALKTASA